MEGRERPPRPPEGRAHLHEAAGVGSGIGVGFDGQDAVGLAPPQLERGFRLHEVVDAGAAAAERLILRLGEDETGDRREDGPLLRPHALRVRQMAGVLERESECERLQLDAWLEPGEELGDIRARAEKEDARSA